jgi:site-specific DNA-methyltransferase (adenine-specific)
VIKPYWRDEEAGLALYCGDMREILPALGLQADLIVADPPYEDTQHEWDRWPDGWLDTAAAHSRSMWCFGSQRMFFRRLTEFTAAGWKLSQDIVGHDDAGKPIYDDVNVVWSKPVATSLATDRFRRCHEHALHWYRGPWRDVHHDVPRVPRSGPNNGRRSKGGRQSGHNGAADGRAYVDDGTRLMLSVIPVPSMPRTERIHHTEKPQPLLEPLIRYGCPPGGLVVDPFAGSCSTLLACRELGLPAIGVELHEPTAEAAARRLSALTLPAA